MGVKENLKEGFRRLWRVLTVLIMIEFVFSVFYMTLTTMARNDEAVLLSFVIVLLLGPLIYIVLYHFGWKAIEWVYDGFAGIEKKN